MPRARLGGMLGGRDGGVQQGRALELPGASVLTLLFVIVLKFAASVITKIGLINTQSDSVPEYGWFVCLMGVT